MSRETGLLAKIYNMVKSVRARMNIVVRSNKLSPNYIVIKYIHGLDHVGFLFISFM